MKNIKAYNTIGLLVIVVTCIFCNAGQNEGPARSLTADEKANYKLVEAFPNLQFDQPIELTTPNDGTDRIFVEAQKGVIHVFPNKGDVKSTGVFLDITNRVVSGGERGLLGLAFHPDYKSNGFFYVNYTTGDSLQTIVSRFKVSASNPNMADPASELVLLRFRQPFNNHNGGKVAFG
ncbi:MAG: PQQ-dependent sugar dehydrogenase, partial [Chitinophagaceae bacterium]